MVQVKPSIILMGYSADFYQTLSEKGKIRVMNVHEKFRKKQNVSPYPFSPYEKGEFSARKDRSPLKWTPTATNNPFVVEWQMEEPIPVKGSSSGPVGNIPGSYF